MRSGFIIVAALAASITGQSFAQCNPSAPVQASAKEPQPFEDEIAQFEAADSANPPRKGGVLFVGSSSIRLWPNLQRDFPRVNALQRGFGGSELSQVVYYAPRIVLPYCPRRVVLYAGDNDLADGKTPEQILHDYKDFVAIVHRAMPNTRIAFVSIKPSRSRWALADRMRATNDMVRAYTATDSLLTYIDVFAPMLGSNGQPRDELLAPDMLHLNARGYALWRRLITPFANGTDR
ncbi:MAG: SGNH/GDSL hydrolase family protein [Gemmatimonadaceae bacterium]